MRKTFFTLVLWLVLSGAAFCQTANTRHLPKDRGAAKATVADFSWLTGNWRGTGFGDLSEETWQPPESGSMIGLFRQHKDGKPLFYEFMLLLEAEGSVQLRLKHFGPDGKGWEEKDEFLTFPLVALEPNAAYFHGLTYRLDGDTLSIFLALEGDDGAFKEHHFLLERSPATVSERGPSR